MIVYIVISKKTNNIMAVYATYARAAKSWNINDYEILHQEVL